MRWGNAGFDRGLRPDEFDTYYVRTYYVQVNVTLSIREELLRRAREVARRQGTSLNTLIRRYLESLAGETSGERTAEDLLELMEEHPGHSGGKRLSRSDAYEGRL